MVATSSDKIPVSLDIPEKSPINLLFESACLLSFFSKSTKSGKVIKNSFKKFFEGYFGDIHKLCHYKINFNFM